MSNFLSFIDKLISQIITFVFGKISWHPPVWLSFLLIPFRNFISYDQALYQRSKQKFYLIKFSLLLLIFITVSGLNWYLSLPEPEYTNLQVLDIRHTSLEVGSLPNPLSVIFDGSAAKIDLVGKDINKQISSTPQISGKWFWKSDRNLVLEPSSDWKTGQTYTVKLKPGLLSKNILLKDYHFTFTTPKITGASVDPKFYEDPIDPNLKQAIATFKFSHQLDKSSFEKHLHLQIKEKNDKEFKKSLNFKVLYNERGNEAYVRSESLTIPRRDSDLRIVVKQGVHSSNAGAATEQEYQANVNIPGVDNYFKILNVEQQIISNPVNHLAERFLIISTSAAAKSKDLLTGLTVAFVDPKPASEDAYSGPECWESPAEIPGDVIARSQKVAVEDFSDQQNPLLHSFKFEAEPGKCLFVKIAGGTPSFSGFALSQDKFYSLETNGFQQEVEILHQGALLAVNGSKKLSILGRNQKAVKFTIHQIFPEAINHLLSQTSADGNFALPEFENYNFGPENIAEVFTEINQFSPAKPGLPQYTNFDFSNFVNSPKGYRGLYYLTAQGYDPETQSLEGGFDRRLILITDLGILVKTDQAKTRSVYLMSFSNQTGVADAKVSVLGKNGVAVFEGKSDSEGRVNLPLLNELQYDKTPTAIIAQVGDDLSFIPWSRNDRRLNFSRFEIGGLYTNDLAKSLTAYAFNDRGIYRPGETVDFGLIVKNQDWTPLISLPLELSISDPAGRQVHLKKINFAEQEFQSYRYQISSEATLGFYELNLTLIDDQKKTRTVLGTSTFKVDEFLPDRLKIKAEFDQPQMPGWVKPNDLKSKVNLINLFGTPAVGNKVKASIALYPGLPDFSNYPGFIFSDPLETKKSFNQELGELITDSEGNSQFDLQLQKYEKGNFFLRVALEGFEKEGGRSVGTTLGTIISPLDYLVGWKATTDLNFVKHNGKATVKVIALSQNLEKIAVANLKIQHFRTEYVSVLAKQPNGSLAYTAVKKEIPLSKQELNLTEMENELSLDTKEPGEYEYLILNDQGLTLTKIKYFVRGEGNVSRELEQNAELKIDLSKKDYNNLEEIEISIQSPYTGTGLITIERDKVYSSKWFKTTTTSSIQKIVIPENLEGNAYVNVVFLRALDSEEIFMSPLSYGVVPFSVSREKHTADLKLTASEKIQSGENLQITLTTNDPVQAVVFAVDEGIHQVARYKQPDPLTHFYQKKALEVTTEQIVDLLLPEFEISEKASATGGDGDSLLGKFKNPFKRKSIPPVVFWSGVKDISGEQNFEFNVPNHFNGNLKIYAVAVNNNKIGIANADTLVQNDLVLQPTAPLAVSPGDKFLVSTTVANTKDIEAKVKVSLTLDQRLSGISELTKELSLAAGTEQLVEFELQAEQFLGSADLNFSVISATSKAEYTLSLAVRPASTQLTTLDLGIKSVGTGEEKINFSKEYYSQEFNRTLTLASGPIAWSLGLGKYLADYPYGCTEQLVSQGIAKFALAHDNTEKILAQEFLSKTFSLLAARQNNDGSISMWPQARFSSEAVIASIHVGRLAIEAKQAGYTVPEKLISELNYYLRDLAGSSNLKDEALIHRAYASYVLVRSGNLVGNYLTALKSDLEIAKPAPWALAFTRLLMAAAYQVQMQEAEANNLLKKLPIELELTKNQQLPFYLSGLAYQGFYLDLVSKHFPLMAKSVSDKFWESVLDKLRNSEQNTFSASSMIMAIKNSSAAAEMLNNISVSYSVNGIDFKPVELNGENLKSVELPGNVKEVRLSGEKDKRYFYQVSTTGFEKNPSRLGESAGVEVNKEYLDSQGKQLLNFKQGEDIYVHLSFRALPGKSTAQFAIVDLLPAGLELAGGSAQLAFGSKVATTLSDWSPTFFEAREDRVILFGSLGESLKSYVYKAKVASSGQFVVPGTVVQDMYDLKTYARGAMTDVVVSK